MSIQKQKFVILIIVTFFVVTPFFANAFNLLDPLVRCGRSDQAAPCTIADFFAQIAYLTNWLIAVAGLFFLQRLVNHGFWLIITMGNEEALTKHKNGLTNAVLGFVMILMAFMFINTTVNLLLGVGRCKTKLDLTDPYNYIRVNETLVQCRGN